MRVTVKNYKRAAWASEETDCYEASLYLDGKRVGSSRNDGHGGNDHVLIEPEHREAWREAVDEWVESVQDDLRFCWTDRETGAPKCYANEETMIGEACEIFRREKEMKQTLKKAEKQGYPRVLRIETPIFANPEVDPLLCSGHEIRLLFIDGSEATLKEVLNEVLPGETGEGSRVWICDLEGLREMEPQVA